MSAIKYCESCRRKHPSDHWYGVSSFQYCCASYTRMFRRGYLVCHPSWSNYQTSAYQRDKTGAFICAAVYRKDVLAIRDGSAMMASSFMKPQMRMLVSLLASTYYFPWPSHAFILRVVGLACAEPSKAILARIGGEVYRQFQALRVVHGQLVAAPSTTGISCTKSPSERRCGSIRFNSIIKHFSSVLIMLDRMEAYFAQNPNVSVAAMLKVLGKSRIYNKVPHYKNIRCCRILAEASGKRFQDCAQDFAVFRRMSPRMRTVLKARGVDDFKTVKKFIDGMKQTTGLSAYCLNDFIIYSCLLDETIFVRMFPV